MITEKMIDELRLGTFKNDDYLLNAKDVAAMLNCSTGYVYKLANWNRLASIQWKTEGEGVIKPRKFIRFEKSRVQNFIKERKK